MADLLARGSYDDTHPLDPAQAQRFSRRRYAAEFATLPAASRKRMEDWWGTPADSGDTLRSPDRRDRQEDRLESRRRRAGRRRRSRGATSATTCSRR